MMKSRGISYFIMVLGRFSNGSRRPTKYANNNSLLCLFYFNDSHLKSYFLSFRKVFLHSSLDIYLLMSLDWPEQEKFMETCGNETWFSHVSLLFKANASSSTALNSNNSGNFSFNGIDIKVLEKLSILLQKLSRIK